MILTRENLWKLAPILKGRRKKAGIAQQHMVDRMGYSNVCMSKIEHGKYLPNIGILIDWCEQLGLEIVIREAREHDRAM